MNYYRFYVYAYIRAKDSDTALAGTPYYIGKGTGYRAYNDHENVRTPKDRDRIIILEANLSHLGACAIERRLIRWWGKVYDGSGILRNIHDGGDSGAHGIKASEETKQKMRKARIGKRHSEETIQKMKIAQAGDRHRAKSADYIHPRGMLGKKASEDTKLKMSLAHKGKSTPKSEDTKMKISLAKKGVKMSEEQKRSKSLTKANGIQFVTPVGVYSCIYDFTINEGDWHQKSSVNPFTLNNLQKVTKHFQEKYGIPEVWVGKTFAEIGFGIISPNS